MPLQNNVLSAKLTDEQWKAIDKAIPAFRKATGENKSYSDIARDGARALVESMGGAWPTDKPKAGGGRKYTRRRTTPGAARPLAEKRSDSSL